MTTSVFFIMMVLVIWLQWQPLKHSSSITRWLTFVALALSGAVLFYLDATDEIFYPSVWLHHLLAPFDPIG